jgi:hypothetical protein
VTLIALTCLFATACQRDGGIVGRGELPGVSGQFVIEDDDRTVALASVQHSVFYEVGKGRQLIFKGAGGEMPRLFLASPDMVVLRYCRGSIYKVESSFFDQPGAPAPNGNRSLRLQVVTEPGLTIAGRAIC